MRTLILLAALALSSIGAEPLTGPVGELAKMRSDYRAATVAAVRAFFATHKIPKYKQGAFDQAPLESLENQRNLVVQVNGKPTDETLLGVAEAMLNQAAFPLDFWDRFQRGKCITGY